jgi:hypothetical protein
MIDSVKANISSMNIFQLRDINTTVMQRLSILSGGLEGTPTLATTPSFGPTASKFKCGDFVTFWSNRDRKHIQAIVGRINGKSLSCHATDGSKTKWRVSPGLCRLVGADVVATVPTTPSTSPEVAAPPPASAPSWRPSVPGIW